MAAVFGPAVVAGAITAGLPFDTVGLWMVKVLTVVVAACSARSFGTVASGTGLVVVLGAAGGSSVS